MLDTRLQEAARMVGSLVASGNMAATDAVAATPGFAAEPMSYERQLSCQIWSLDGRLVARSSGAPAGRLTDQASGFSDQFVDGEPWRVYVIDDADKGVRVMVGDRLGLRDRLVADLVKGLLWPALLIAPLLGLLIWASLARGLKPLGAITAALRSRDAEDMRPVVAGHAPAEIRPLADALNALFVKVEAARRQEREVTAFAAHELRTPLAGLKIQAQIALAAPDPATRNGALRQILSSVDRTARLVRQLLALAKLDASASSEPQAQATLGEIIDEIVAATDPATPCRVIVDPTLRDVRTTADREILATALRNLHENAVQHCPAAGAVTWRPSPDGCGVVVEDEGPGIPEDELPLVRQRFFRGRNRSPVGSGLGLAIVDAAAAKIGWSLHLENCGEQHGLRAELRPLRRPARHADGVDQNAIIDAAE